MPYQTDSEVPDYVPKEKKAQWREVWNSAYTRAKTDGKDEKEAEQSAFAQANGVAGPNGKDTKVAHNFPLNKFFKLAKVDEATHEVWGVATSEVPDKDGEIADYPESKKAFKAWSEEFLKKTTNAGQDPSLGNIRLQHTLEIAGKAIKIEFDDDAKKIWLGTQPVDDNIWNLVKGGFVTGYSMGGNYLWKRKEGKFTRFAPTISEVSYVDNPCNQEATFAYIKADGAMEMRKFSQGTSGELSKLGGTYDPQDREKLVDEIVSRVSEIFEKQKAAGVEKTVAHSCDHCGDELEKDGKTKKKGGKELHSSEFAWVGDPDDPSTWKLPIHDAEHVRNALARFNQTEGIPADKKASVRAKIVAAAKRFNIEVSEKAVTGLLTKCEITDPKLGRWLLKTLNATGDGLQKGMYAVANMARVLEDLYFLCMSTHYEAEAEGDESSIPDELRAVLRSLADTFVSYAEEEAEEIVAASMGGQGAMYMALNLTDVQKAELKAALEKSHKSIMDHLHNLHKLHKAHVESMIDHHEQAIKMHKAHHEAFGGHIENIKKALGVVGAEAEGVMDADGKVGSGPHAGTEHAGKANTADELAKAEKEKADKEAADRAEKERLEKASKDQTALLEQITALTKSVSDLTKANADLLKKTEDQGKQLDSLSKGLEETKVKQTTLVIRDGQELSKAKADAGDVMGDTGL